MSWRDWWPGWRRGRTAATPGRFAEPSLAPIAPRVLLVVYDPLVPRQNTRLGAACGFQSVAPLIEGYVADLAAASGGYLQYTMADTLVVNGLPALEDGYCYTAEEWLHCWQQGGGWHQPQMADYPALLDRLGAPARIAAGEIDEVWLFGPPYAGFWESAMVGPDAYWCNAPPVELAGCQRRFVVMGFNYERGVGEMLEDVGHRLESCVARAFGSWRDWGGHADHAWDRFTAHEAVTPGQAGCGTVHWAPNSQADYDWGNRRAVWSQCDDWLEYPHLTGRRRQVDCHEWGGGDIRAHHRWWLAHLPRANGQSEGRLNNWWAYAVLSAES